MINCEIRCLMKSMANVHRRYENAYLIQCTRTSDSRINNNQLNFVLLLWQHSGDRISRVPVIASQKPNHHRLKTSLGVKLWKKKNISHTTVFQTKTTKTAKIPLGDYKNVNYNANFPSGGYLVCESYYSKLNSCTELYNTFTQQLFRNV